MRKVRVRYICQICGSACSEDIISEQRYNECLLVGGSAVGIEKGSNKNKICEICSHPISNHKIQKIGNI